MISKNTKVPTNVTARAEKNSEFLKACAEICEPIALIPQFTSLQNFRHDTKSNLGRAVNSSRLVYATTVKSAKDLGALYEAGFSIKQSTIASVLRCFVVLDYDIPSLQELCIRHGKDGAWCHSRSISTQLKFLRSCGVQFRELSAALHAEENCTKLDAFENTDWISIHKTSSAIRGTHPYRRKIFVRLEKPVVADLYEDGGKFRNESWESLRMQLGRNLKKAHAYVKRSLGLKGWMLPDMAMQNPSQVTFGAPQDLNLLKRFYSSEQYPGVYSVNVKAYLTYLGINAKAVDPKDICPGLTDTKIGAPTLARQRQCHSTISQVSFSTSAFFQSIGMPKREAANFPHKDMYVSYVQEGRRYKAALGVVNSFVVNAFGQVNYLDALNIKSRITRESVSAQIMQYIKLHFEDGQNFLDEEKDKISKYFYRVWAAFKSDFAGALSKYKATITYKPRYSPKQFLSKCRHALALTKKRVFDIADGTYAYFRDAFGTPGLIST